MTRILVQRGSGASTSNPNRPSSTSQQQPPASQASPVSKEEEQDRKAIQDPGGLDDLVDQSVGAEDKTIIKTEEIAIMSGSSQISKGGSFDDDDNAASDKNAATINDLDPLQIAERAEHDDSMGAGTGPSQIVTGGSYPPPPPVPPPKPSPISSSRRLVLGSPNAVRIGASRRPSSRPVVSSRSSPSDSRPSSPRSYVEAEGYNSADEQNSCFASSYDDTERERLFELDLRRAKGLEVKRMVEDGNCLFRAVADQVYGDPEVYDMARQMCIDYMERERDHFSQFITEGFTSYCKRKRRDKVYGNNVEIQAFSEMYNRPIHIYSYSTEPINIFHGSYNTDSPPIRLSYHYGNHYNSLVDPRRLTIGAGLGFSSLRGSNVDKDQIKAAIRAQQDQQIDNALLAEGRFCSDIELTEKEIERMVMEASRAEYLAEDKLKQLGYKESSRSGAEPSSSGATTTGPSRSDQMMEVGGGIVFNSSVQMVLAMGFSYLQVIEAYSIFGEDVDSMVCYLLEMGGTRASSGSNCRKGKAAE